MPAAEGAMDRDDVFRAAAEHVSWDDSNRPASGPARAFRWWTRLGYCDKATLLTCMPSCNNGNDFTEADVNALTWDEDNRYPQDPDEQRDEDGNSMPADPDAVRAHLAWATSDERAWNQPGARDNVDGGHLSSDPAGQQARPRGAPAAQPRAYPLAYSVLSHLQAPVTLYGFFLPIWLHGWWSILFVPLAAKLGNMLDRTKSLDGSPIGNAFTTSTIFTLTATLHALLSLAHGSLGGFGGWCLALTLAYNFVASVGGATPNFEFSGFCACLGIAAMLLQAVDGLEGTHVAGGWWPLALAAAGTFISSALTWPGMPFHQSDAELMASAFAPDGQGYGTGHHAELDRAARQHGQRRRR